MDDSTRWRQKLLDSVHQRNKIQVDTFQEIFATYHRLFEQLESMRQNWATRAAVSTESPTDGATATHSALFAANERIQALEQKVFGLQEELTDLHRRRSENAQLVVELNTELAQSRQLISERDQLLAERLVEAEDLRRTVFQLEQKHSELSATTQTLKDEYQALHLTLVRTEKTLVEVQTERDTLLSRWIELKSRDVDRMNAENDDFVRRRQQQVQRALEEATKEEVVVPNDSCSTPVCIASSLPTKCINSFDAHESEVNALCWSPSGRYLASGGGDRRIKLWTNVTSQQQCVGQYSGSNKAINSIAIDSDESLLLAASNDLASRVWGVSDFRLKYTLTGHSGQVMTARFLDGSRRAVTGSRDRTLKLWELNRGGDCAQTLFASSICFDVIEHHNSQIISGHFDSTIKVWDPRASFQPRHTIPVDGHVTSLSLSSEFRVLCSTRDDTLKMVDLRTLSIFKRYVAEGFHLGSDFCRASLSPDGKYAACGGSSPSAAAASSELFVWSCSSQKLETRITETDFKTPTASSSSQPACIMSSAWQPSGGCIVTCDKNRRISVWGAI